MMLDSLIVGATVLGAAGYLAWRLFAKPRTKGACAACPKARHG